MKEISINDFKINPFTVFSKDWMALTVGNEQNGYNAMTIAWDSLALFGSVAVIAISFPLPFAMCVPVATQKNLPTRRSFSRYRIFRMNTAKF